jgi:uncharacterized protein
MLDTENAYAIFVTSLRLILQKKMKPKQERRRLRELYSAIPTFECIEGCTDCCGPVAASREERARNPELMDLETARDLMDVLIRGGASVQELEKAPQLTAWGQAGADCLTCPYARKGLGCAIYADRPFLCRLYGTIPSLQCPHGRRPEKLLSNIEERRLVRSYLELFPKQTRRMVSEENSGQIAVD